MLTILLMGELGTRLDALANLLETQGHTVERLAPERLLHLDTLMTVMQPHLVLIDYSDPMRDSVEQFCFAPLGSTSPLLLLAQDMEATLMARLRQAGLVVYSGASTETAQIMTLMPVLDSMLARERQLRHQVDVLQQELTDRRDIERAKDYLTLKLQCSGDEAYTALRKRAMQERSSLGDLARAILTHRNS
ncbi:MAG: hypothetical protein RLY58_1127 [Pseudomonadota bacterium]|jgi:response regulator NasT